MINRLHDLIHNNYIFSIIVIYMVIITTIMFFLFVKRYKQKKPFRLKLSIAVLLSFLTVSLLVLRVSLLIIYSRPVSITLQELSADEICRLEYNFSNTNDSGEFTRTNRELSPETYTELIGILNGLTYKYQPFFDYTKFHNRLHRNTADMQSDLHIYVLLNECELNTVYLREFYAYENSEGVFYSYMTTNILKSHEQDWVSKT